MYLCVCVDMCDLYFGHLMQRADSFEKTLMLGKIEGREGIRGWDGWMASQMQWTRTWANSRRWGGTGRPGMLQSMGSRRVKTRLGDRTTTRSIYIYLFIYLCIHRHVMWEYVCSDNRLRIFSLLESGKYVQYSLTF